jgi:hypothetical protein
MNIPPLPLMIRWADSSKYDLLAHAQKLEETMRVLAALLEGRDAENGGGTPSSIRTIAEAKELARREP